MPFIDAEALPAEVMSLPKEAQSIWLSVFNSTYRTFSGTEQEKEEASFIAAWSTVKSQFARNAQGKWQRKAQRSFDDGPFMKSQFMRFVKFTPNLMEASKRITLGEVYVPYDVDSHGDFADEETIEEAAYSWMAKYQNIGEQHKLFGGKGVVVENFLSRKGDSQFQVPGTWVLGVQWSPDMWEKVLNGEVTGYSLAGKGISLPIVAGREQAKSVVLTKSNVMMGELDESLFEEPTHEGPRVISQIIKLEPGEVSGVTTPATRRTFKLFKGETMNPQVHIVAPKAEAAPSAPAPTEQDPKAAPNSPWLKLYNQLISDGYTPEEARRFAEQVLGPPPPGTVTEEEQSQSLGLLKSVSAIVAKIAKSLGVNGAENEEDLPMTPQEKERFDALEKGFGEMKSSLEAIAKAIGPKEEAVQKCNCGGSAPAAIMAPAANVKREEKASESAAPAPAQAEGEPLPAGVDLTQLNADVLEIAKRVMAMEDRFNAFESAPGVSGVEMALVPSEGGIQKSAGFSGGYEHSSILGAPLPAGARKAVVDEAIKKQEARNKRVERASAINLRMG